MSRFEKFLINRNLLDTFKYNLKHCRVPDITIDQLCSKTHGSLFVDKAFDWHLTKEGRCFWRKVSDEWRRVYNDEDKI